MADPQPTRRILLATTGFHVGGGIASVNRSIARALDEECRGGRLEWVDRLALEEAPGAPGPWRGESRCAERSPLRFAWHAWRLVSRRRPDLVIADHVGVARALRLPLPGLPPPRTALFVHGGELRGVYGRRREAVLRGAERVLTNSRCSAGWLLERFPELADRVHPVLLCIDPGHVERWEAAALPRPEREPAVLIVGRMLAEEPGKGHDALLEGWGRVLAAQPRAQLWVVGDGDDRPRLEARGRELRLGDSVRFLGRIGDEELALRYRRAAVYAMPSRQEGFGLVYAEAMWHGLPCLGSYADAAAEVIRAEETGLLVPYGDGAATADALVRLLGDRALREAMGREAEREARERFAYPRFRRDLLAALGLAA